MTRRKFAKAVSIGAAMAQVEGGSTYPVAPIAQPSSGADQIQSGSSDVTPANPASPAEVSSEQ